MIRFLTPLAAAALALSGPAQAQTPTQGQWAPTKTVRMIVAYPAGGPTDR